MNRITNTILTHPSLWPGATKAAACRILGIAQTKVRTHGVSMLARTGKGLGVWCSIGGLEYEPEMRTVIGLLHAGDVFVDVGANVGVYTLHAARKVGPGGKVLFFEPTLETFEAARANVNLNEFAHVKGFNAAVADVVGQMEFIVCKSGNSNYLSSGAVDDARKSVETRKVPVDTIDAMAVREGVPRIDFLKVDAEGAEEMVLKGAALILARDNPSVLFESLNDGKRKEFGLLESFGYQIFHYLGNNWIKAESGQGGNFLAVARPSHLDRLVKPKRA
jgi:FkbM family methyltransferase